MASIRKHPTGWRAEVFKNGLRRSKVFATKAEAKEWSARQEFLLGTAEEPGNQEPLSTLFTRYAREVSSDKRGERWEVLRLATLSKDKIGAIAIADLRPADFAEWRDRRLAKVSPGTVRREMVLVGAVLSVARREWGVIKSNPMEGVKRPADPPPRDRLPTANEMERLQHAAGTDLTTIIGRAFHAFRFACETGMRAGEICGLTRGQIVGAVARLPRTKNGSSRDVPLSSAALALLEALPPNDPVFGLDVRQLDSQWRKLRDRAGVEGLTFHDSRHAAITRLSRVLDVLALARVVGHRDIRQLQTYYSEAAADLARRLG